MKMKAILATIVGVFFLYLPGSGNALPLQVNIDATVNDVSTPVFVSLDAGIYELTPVDQPYEGWSAWITSDRWFNVFWFSSPEIAETQVNDWTTYASATDAFNGFVGATFTLSVAQDVSFYIKDTPITDNRGGISLNVSPVPAPVPEPTTILLFGAGLAGLAAIGRRRKA